MEKIIVPAKTSDDVSIIQDHANPREQPGGVNKEFAALVEASAHLNDMRVILTLTAEYIDLPSVGDSFRGIFIGESTMDITDKETGERSTIPIVRFLVDKQVKIHGGAALVSEIRKHDVQQGQPVEVTFTGKSGKTKIYSVSLLGA